MNYQDFLQPLLGGASQAITTLILLMIGIVLVSKSKTGGDILNGALKEKDNTGEYKFSMGRLLLLFTILVYCSVFLAFKNSYSQFVGTAHSDDFIKISDNIEGYAYKIPAFLLAYVFGNKAINLAHAYINKDKPDALDAPQVPPVVETPPAPQV